MSYSPAIAESYAELYTSTELEEVLRDALTVFSGAGEVTKSFSGGSITIDRGNCEAIIENLREARRIQSAAAAGPGSEADVTKAPLASGVSFRFRRISD